jgi:hypothetical protein
MITSTHFIAVGTSYYYLNVDNCKTGLLDNKQSFEVTWNEMLTHDLSIYYHADFHVAL